MSGGRVFGLAVMTATSIISGCQTSVSYTRIGPGPDLEYSLAKCEIAASSTEQGMFAMGSTGYVFGAQLGNAIGNEIRRQEFIKRCMILNGWRQGTSEVARAGRPQYQPVTAQTPYATQLRRPPTTLIAGQ